MGLRDLIFENKTKEQPKKEKNNSLTFPKPEEGVIKGKTDVFVSDEAGKFDFKNEGFAPKKDWSSTPILTGASCEPHISNVMDLYEKGFDELNIAGYDFYEFYKAVMQAGPEKPDMYKMALTMAKAMDPNVSKASLIKTSEYYLTEIAEVYKEYAAQGKYSKASIESKKEQEEASLKTDLTAAQRALKSAQNDISNIETELKGIDNKYASELHDIKCKLEANDTAKREIFNSINKVKQGINANL